MIVLLRDGLNFQFPERAEDAGLTCASDTTLYDCIGITFLVTTGPNHEAIVLLAHDSDSSGFDFGFIHHRDHDARNELLFDPLGQMAPEMSFREPHAIVTEDAIASPVKDSERPTHGIHDGSTMSCSVYL